MKRHFSTYTEVGKKSYATLRSKAATDKCNNARDVVVVAAAAVAADVWPGEAATTAAAAAHLFELPRITGNGEKRRASSTNTHLFNCIGKVLITVAAKAVFWLYNWLAY